MPDPEPTRALAVLVETGLMTVEEQRALSTATGALQIMKAVSTAPGKRHFNRIDTLITVRTPSPIMEARNVLAGLHEVWDGVQKKFHKYREIFFESKLRRAKLSKLRKDAAAAKDEDERLILEAEADLEQARIDAMEAQVAEGHAEMKSAIEKAKAQSNRYDLIVKETGKQFTEEDFRAEELTYYLKSAWWHAAQEFSVYDPEDEWGRPEKAKTKEEAWNQKYDPVNGTKWREQINLSQEVLAFFKSIGITEVEVKNEIRALNDMREAFSMAHSTRSPQPFAGHFDGWLNRATSKYRDRLVAAVGRGGMELLDRIQKLLKPRDDEEASPDVGELKRSRVTE